MAEFRMFATAQQAADIGGITPADIGVAPTAFVRKSELIGTGKFDNDKIVEENAYDFVHLDNIYAKVSSELTVEPTELNFIGAGDSKDIVIRTEESWVIE